MEERLQKILARAGFGSRRSCEELITSGRVTVNGKIAALGSKADSATDIIRLDGKQVTLRDELVYIALNKPRGVLSSVSAPDPRPTVVDLVSSTTRLYPVGRLDVDSEGLILLTNDGDLTNRITHPRYGHDKEYRVLIARRPDEEQLETWRRGVVLEDDHRTAPAEVRIEGIFGKGSWLRVVMREGRKRQIRETGAAIGLPVVRIIRVRIGSLHLGSLKPREWRHLTSDEVDSLKGISRTRPTVKTAAVSPRGAASKTSLPTAQRAVRKPVVKIKPSSTGKAPAKPTRRTPASSNKRNRPHKPKSRG